MKANRTARLKTFARFVIGFVLLFLWVATFPPFVVNYIPVSAITFAIIAAVWYSKIKLRLKVLVILGIVWTWWNLWEILFVAHYQNFLAVVLTFLILSIAGVAALVCLYWLVTNLIDKKMSGGSLVVFFLIWFGVSASSLATVSASDLTTLLGAILGATFGGLIVAVPLFLLARWIARKTMKVLKKRK